MNLPNRIKAESLEKIINLSKRIIDRETNIVESAREIDRLRFQLDNSEDEIFYPIISFTGDTEQFLFGEARKLMSEELKKKRDKELQEYLELETESLIEACKKIVAKFALPLS